VGLDKRDTTGAGGSFAIGLVHAVHREWYHDDLTLVAAIPPLAPAWTTHTMRSFGELIERA
jgi:hypothetical protein